MAIGGVHVSKSQKLKQADPIGPPAIRARKNAADDMIFNLGAKKLVSTFVQFDRRIREANWSKAAECCSRTQVSASRNEYVRKLLLGAGAGK